MYVYHISEIGSTVPPVCHSGNSGDPGQKVQYGNEQQVERSHGLHLVSDIKKVYIVLCVFFCEPTYLVELYCTAHLIIINLHTFPQGGHKGVCELNYCCAGSNPIRRKDNINKHTIKRTEHFM